MRGCVALRRGPVVYCVEQAGLPAGVVLEDLALVPGSPLSAASPVAGVDALVTVEAVAVHRPATGGPLYRAASAGAVGTPGPAHLGRADHAAGRALPPLGQPRTWGDAGVAARGGATVTRAGSATLALDEARTDRENAMSTAKRGTAVTMHEVAARAGVSIKTVSNVVNGYQYIRPATKERVEAAIADLGYQVNISARNLRRGRTGIIGLAVPELSLPYFAELADSVIRAAEARGLTVLIEQTGSVRERELEVLSGAASPPHRRPDLLAAGARAAGRRGAATSTSRWCCSASASSAVRRTT